MELLNVALVGGSGFIGTHCSEAFLAQGHRVTVVSRGSRPRRPTLRLRYIDRDAQSIDEATLAPFDVVINLVGIKRTTHELTWSTAHVTIPQHLAQLCADTGKRFIHVSVAGARPATDAPYLQTKWEGERAVHNTNPDATILRPGIVYGPGDDMLTKLVGLVRQSPIFPAPAGGRARVAVVDVKDIASAVVEAAHRSQCRGRSYDLVGPQAVTLRELVERVARATRHKLWVIPAPAMPQRVAASILEQISSDPLLTRSQLKLLSEGVTGDLGPASRDLEFQPSPLDLQKLRNLIEADHRLWRPPASVSLRLRPNHPPTPPTLEFERSRLAAFGLLALVLSWAAPLVWASSLWWRTLSLNLVLLAIASAWLPIPWRRWFRASSSELLQGIFAGGLLYGLGYYGSQILFGLFPALETQRDLLYERLAGGELTVIVVTLPIIVLCEEVLWRGIFGLGLRRLGFAKATLASGALFALAHISAGPPLLALAAAMFGATWTLLALRFDRLAPSLACHLLWDLLVFFAAPYPG